MAITIDLSAVEEFTLGDIVDFEQYGGMSFSDLHRIGTTHREGDALPLTMRAVMALLWIIKRREDPAFTFERVRDMKLADLAALNVNENPTQAGASEGRPARRKRGS